MADEIYLIMNKTCGYVSEKVFQILSVHEKSREKYQKCLADLFINSTTKELALDRIGLLERVPQLDDSIVSSIRQHYFDSSILKNDKRVLKRVNNLLERYGFEQLSDIPIQVSNPEEDLPF